MYNGIGLQTPRGSGTNGYVQTNKFFVRPKTSKVAVDGAGGKPFGPDQGTGGITKKPNKEILEHDRKRQIELKLVILEDKLVEQGYTDVEIAAKLAETRSVLEAADAAAVADGGGGIAVLSDNKGSDTQTHQIAARKEKQMEILGAALGIDYRPDDGEFEEGEILRGRGNRYTKTGRQMGENVESEEVDRSRSLKNLESQRDAERGETLSDKVPKKMTGKETARSGTTTKKRYHGDSEDSGSEFSSDSWRRHNPVKKTKKASATASKKHQDSDSDSGLSGEARQKGRSAKLHKHSDATKKKRHDTDTESGSESDSSADDRRSYSLAKKTKKSSHVGAKKSSHVGAKKRYSSGSDSDASIDSRGRYSPPRETKKTSLADPWKRHDSDSEDDSGKGTMVRSTKMTVISKSDGRLKEQEVRQKQVDRKWRKEDDYSDNESDERLGSGSDADEHSRRGKERRSGTSVKPKAGRLLPGDDELGRYRSRPESDDDAKNGEAYREDEKPKGGRIDGRNKYEDEEPRKERKSKEHADDEPRKERNDGRNKHKDEELRKERKSKEQADDEPRKERNDGRNKYKDEEPRKERKRKEHADDEEPRKERNDGRNKYRDVEPRKERKSKVHADDEGRSKYISNHREEEEQSYRRTDETPQDESRKRGRNEESQDRSRRDERDRDISKSGRYDDSRSRDSRRYESDKHDSGRSRH